jgi:hypothetical protein
MIECEVQSHDAYGTPKKVFAGFFSVIADTLRAIPGTDWSPVIEEARRRLLTEIDRVSPTHPTRPGCPPPLDGPPSA